MLAPLDDDLVDATMDLMADERWPAARHQTEKSRRACGSRVRTSSCSPGRRPSIATVAVASCAPSGKPQRHTMQPRGVLG